MLLLISGALTAGKYVSQRSTESRSQAAGGQRYIVCPSGSPGANGCDFVGLAGLQQGIDRVPSDSTFLMKPGVYKFTEKVLYQANGTNEIFESGLLLNSNKTISIIGEGDVVMDGKYYSGLDLDAAILIAAGSLTIEGITITNFHHYGTLSLVNSNLTIKNSVVKNGSNNGIAHSSNGTLKVEKSTIKDVKESGIIAIGGTAIIDGNSVSSVQKNNGSRAHGIDCGVSSKWWAVKHRAILLCKSRGYDSQQPVCAKTTRAVID